MLGANEPSGGATAGLPSWGEWVSAAPDHFERNVLEPPQGMMSFGHDRHSFGGEMGMAGRNFGGALGGAGVAAGLGLSRMMMQQPALHASLGMPVHQSNRPATLSMPSMQASMGISSMGSSSMGSSSMLLGQVFDASGLLGQRDELLLRRTQLASLEQKPAPQNLHDIWGNSDVSAGSVSTGAMLRFGDVGGGGGGALFVGGEHSHLQEHAFDAGDRGGRRGRKRKNPAGEGGAGAAGGKRGAATRGRGAKRGRQAVVEGSIGAAASAGVPQQEQQQLCVASSGSSAQPIALGASASFSIMAALENSAGWDQASHAHSQLQPQTSLAAPQWGDQLGNIGQFSDGMEAGSVYGVGETFQGSGPMAAGGGGSGGSGGMAD